MPFAFSLFCMPSILSGTESYKGAERHLYFVLAKKSTVNLDNATITSLLEVSARNSHTNSNSFKGM